MLPLFLASHLALRQVTHCHHGIPLAVKALQIALKLSKRMCPAHLCFLQSNLQGAIFATATWQVIWEAIGCLKRCWAQGKDAAKATLDAFRAQNKNNKTTAKNNNNNQ
jgi:hypothetical protein